MSSDTEASSLGHPRKTRLQNGLSRRFCVYNYDHESIFPMIKFDSLGLDKFLSCERGKSYILRHFGRCKYAQLVRLVLALHNLPTCFVFNLNISRVRGVTTNIFGIDVAFFEASAEENSKCNFLLENAKLGPLYSSSCFLHGN